VITMPAAGAPATGLGDLLLQVGGAWDWRPAVLLVIGALAALYLRGWTRLRRTRRTGAAPGWRLAAYLIGLGCVFLALCSPLELLAELSFTAHMVQHQLLMMGAPPLLLLAAPFPVVLWALPPPLRRRIGALVARPGPARRVLSWLTRMPVAGVLYTVTLWGWHHPVAYEAALRYPVLHDIEHLTFFGTAVLFWWPIVNPAPRFRRLSSGLMYGARIGYLILATAQNTMLGAVLGMSERVFYPSYAAAPRLLGDWGPLDDQAFGGGVMWSGSHMFLLAVLVLLHRAMDSEGRKAGARARPIV
jgi:putative membrane protein